LPIDPGSRQNQQITRSDGTRYRSICSGVPARKTLYASGIHHHKPFVQRPSCSCTTT